MPNPTAEATPPVQTPEAQAPRQPTPEGSVTTPSTNNEPQKTGAVAKIRNFIRGLRPKDAMPAVASMDSDKSVETPGGPAGTITHPKQSIGQVARLGEQAGEPGRKSLGEIAGQIKNAAIETAKSVHREMSAPSTGVNQGPAGVVHQQIHEQYFPTEKRPIPGLPSEQTPAQSQTESVITSTTSGPNTEPLAASIEPVTPPISESQPVETPQNASAVQAAEAASTTDSNTEPSPELDQVASLVGQKNTSDAPVASSEASANSPQTGQSEIRNTPAISPTSENTNTPSTNEMQFAHPDNPPLDQTANQPSVEQSAVTPAASQPQEGGQQPPPPQAEAAAQQFPAQESPSDTANVPEKTEEQKQKEREQVEAARINQAIRLAEQFNKLRGRPMTDEEREKFSAAIAQFPPELMQRAGDLLAPLSANPETRNAMQTTGGTAGQIESDPNSALVQAAGEVLRNTHREIYNNSQKDENGQPVLSEEDSLFAKFLAFIGELLLGMTAEAFKGPPVVAAKIAEESLTPASSA